jgi:5-methyltetrahydropteroyltriglutamate--homocysteine methyltransferase
MTKWFDTNYHYIVPEFETGHVSNAPPPFDEFLEALELGIRTKPVLIGPLTYLHLGKSVEPGLDRLTLLERLLPAYTDILRRLETLGAEWVQLDEPILAFELESNWQAAFLPAYQALRSAASGTKLLLATYFGELRENLPLAASLPVDALHCDLTRAAGELQDVVKCLPSSMSLSLGWWTGVTFGETILSSRFSRLVRAKASSQFGAHSDSTLVLAPAFSGRFAETALDADVKRVARFCRKSSEK